jgi:hypothetical protein
MGFTNTYKPDEVAYTNSSNEDVKQSDLMSWLRAECACLSDSEIFPEASLWKAFYSSITYLSTLLCWNSEACANFYFGKRYQQEVFEPGCGCDGKWLTIKPLYKANIKDDSFKLTVTIIGSKVTTIDIPSEDIEYIEVTNTVRVNMNQTFIDSDGNSVNPVCDCDCCSKEIIASLEYESGFDTLPECLIDTICKMVSYNFNSQCGLAASDCSVYTRVHPNAYLTKETTSGLSYEWKIIEPQDNFRKMLEYIDEYSIYRFSNCSQIINDLSGVIYDSKTKA